MVLFFAHHWEELGSCNLGNGEFFRDVKNWFQPSIYEKYIRTLGNEIDLLMWNADDILD